MPIRNCLDCKLVFIALGNLGQRNQRCPSCKTARHKQQQRESQRRRLGARRINEQQGDISEAEIEARFQAALREGKAVKREIELGRNYSWQYREPKG